MQIQTAELKLTGSSAAHDMQRKINGLIIFYGCRVQLNLPAAKLNNSGGPELFKAGRLI